MGVVLLPNPEFGDMKLNVFPIQHEKGKRIDLPTQFKMYENSLNAILSAVPVQRGAEEHYVTIDSKFFSTDDFLRREGIHIDGNFCADPNFRGPDNEPRATWGGTQTTWGGTRIDPSTWGAEISWGATVGSGMVISKDWESEHDLQIPVGKYVSSKLGGLIVVSNEVGCRAWKGNFEGYIGNEGECSAIEAQLTSDKELTLKKNEVWMMSSNTPHETLMIDKGKRRTFMRITLNHRYDNTLLLGT